MVSDTLDTTSIDFIICANDALWLSECETYIRHLHIPDGMSVGVIPVWDAHSMCNGYNTGMKQSSARYKVYLHQDTFIINRNFIAELLHVFEAAPQIGIVGLIGSKEQKLQSITYSSWNYGSVVVNSGFIENFYEFGTIEDAYQTVDFVDGMLIATQYDLPWREDIFTEWDFYDKSICMEFRKQGYLTVVPRQEKPWCIHDCGPSNLFHWKQNALRFIQAYPEYFPTETTKIGITKNMQESALAHLHIADMDATSAYNAGNFQTCIQIIRNELICGHEITKNMVTLLHLSYIYLQTDGNSMFFSENATPEAMCASYIKAHLLLRRFCYGLTLSTDERTFLDKLRPEEKDYIIDTELTFSVTNQGHPGDAARTAVISRTDSINERTTHLKHRVRRLIRFGKLDDASELCIASVRSGYIDRELYIFFILFIIRMKEQTVGQTDIFQVSDNPNVLINHYRTLKFLVRRQEFSQMKPMQDELYSYCRETNTSGAALETIAEYSTLDSEQIIEKIRKELTSYE